MRRLAVFSTAFAAAAAVYVYCLRGTPVLWIAGVCLALSPLALRLGLRRFCAGFLGAAAGFLWCFGYQQLWLAPVERVCGTEQIRTVQLLEQPVASTYGAWATVEIELEGRSFEAVLYGDASLLEAGAGDRVTASMKAASSERDSQYLQAKGAALCLYGESELTVEKGVPNRSVRVRLWLQERIHRLYEGDAGGLVQALLTGDRSDLSDAVQNDLSVAGLSHAVAVSGMHVSMLLAMVVFCCGNNPRLTAVVGIPLVVLFVGMTGASPSACRAAVMQTLLLAAPLARRENDPPTALGAAALLLLLQNPWVIASVSFQLSFAAVAGLLLFSEPIQKRILAWKKEPGRLLQFVASTVSASLSATALTLPLTVFYFQLVSISAVLTNLLALWAVTGVFTLGLLSCFLGAIFAFPAELLAKYVLWLCRTIAAFPYAAAYPQNLPLMLWAVGAYGAAYWLLLGKKRQILWPLCGLTAAFLACILWGRWNLEAAVFRVLDVGQGQCTLLEHEGFTAVIDCGGEDPAEAGELLARTLHSGGQTHVDALVLTHYDRDHAGGALQLLHQVSVEMVFLPEVPDESGLRQAVEEAAEAAGSQVFPVSVLTEVAFSGGKLTIYPPVSRENDNNSGICVLATAAECDILITGDLDQYMEMRLLSRWALPDVEVLVAGHHGARSSTSALLLETVSPELVVISVGAENTYGHPAGETLERIAQSGAEIRRTDEDGTVAIHK